ncbi:MAG: dUTP diphosphatase [Planctomycetota bacterium]
MTKPPTPSVSIPTPPPTVRFQKLDERAAVPAYQTELAAGLDLAACLPRGDVGGPSVIIPPGAIVKVPTGLACAIPPGFEGQVRPRSGLSTKHGVTLPNSPGTVDADYRGEMFVALINLGPEPFEIHHGDRVAQLVVCPIAHCVVEVVGELDATGRGSGGFGSTGGVAGAAR